MKAAEQEEARRLRSEEGLSVSVIATRLHVAKSTASRWVRDVPLTEEQKTLLTQCNPVYNRALCAGEQIKQRARALRKNYQETGRQKAKEDDALHLAGCMLYWAEGSKSRNVLSFTNSDSWMRAFFLRFLRRCYAVQDSEITVHINCFDDVASVESIEIFWLETLCLPRSCLGKTTLNRYTDQSQKKRRNKLAYGTCRFNICRTDIVQSIFGAIQEYAGVEVDTWLD